MFDISARLPAAGEHQHRLHQHLAPVVQRCSFAGVRDRRRQRIAEPQPVGATSRRRAIRRGPRPGRRRLPPPPEPCCYSSPRECPPGRDSDVSIMSESLIWWALPWMAQPQPTPTRERSGPRPIRYRSDLKCPGTTELVQRVGEQNARSDRLSLSPLEIGRPVACAGHRTRGLPPMGTTNLASVAHKPAAAVSSGPTPSAVPPQHSGVDVDDEPPARRVARVAADRPWVGHAGTGRGQSYDSPGTGRTARVAAPS